jgi:PST family polysaccharide transporter
MAGGAIGATYVAFALRTLVPLVVLPFLSHRLGTAGFGAVLAGQSLAQFGTILLEWGFNLSGLRDVSAADTDEERAAVVSRVVGARLLLVPPVVAIVCSLAWATPVLGDEPSRILAACALSLAIGLTPLWYFQGRGRAAFAAALELAGALVSLGAILLLVRDPDDVATALLCISAGPACAYAYGTRRLLAEVPWFRLSPREAARALRAGFPIFVAHASGTVQAVASTWLIALLSTAQAAAYYGVAYRLLNVAVAGAFEPLAQVATPRAVRLAAEAPDRVRAFAARLGAVHLAVALAGVAGVHAFGGFVIGLAFAPELAPAIRATELLSWILLPVALARASGFYVLLPLRRDGAITLAVGSGGVAVLLLAVLLAPAHGAEGMVWARLAGETVAAVLATAAAARGLGALSSARG